MQNSSKRSLVIASVAFVGACLLYSDLYAQATGQSSRESSNSFTSLEWFPDSGNSGTIANSSSVLIRNKNGVAYTTSTTGLLPGGAYTTWWVIFNNPEFCSPPSCAAKDFPQNMGDPRVQASVLWATGRVVDGHGQGNLSAHLAAGGRSAAPGQILFGPALLDAFGAEIHLVVRSHGPALTGDNLKAQLTTFLGGCSINKCEDQQFAQHFPGEDQKD